MTSRRSRLSLVESSEPLEVVVDPWLQLRSVVVVEITVEILGPWPSRFSLLDVRGKKRKADNYPCAMIA